MATITRHSRAIERDAAGYFSLLAYYTNATSRFGSNDLSDTITIIQLLTMYVGENLKIESSDITNASSHQFYSTTEVRIYIYTTTTCDQ